ncbi:MBL fold metallo-hydrolase [Balneolaceae bacterium ANBcel3]|nr:MBL fold metallo-hydrolase [Balneolaceae bacterium ANBcel3]
MIKALSEGIFSVGTDGRFFSHAKDAPAKRGTLVVGIHPFLIKNSEVTALIDAGLGPYGPEDHSSIMTDNLARHHTTPEDIEAVFCSHLHTDHIGGLLYEQHGTFKCMFPNASIWLSGKDWDRFKSNAEKKGHDFSIKWALYLETYADLHFIEDEQPEWSSFRMETIGGHTPNHQAVIYEHDSEKALMLGDVLGRTEAINRSFTAKYDHDGKRSQQLRDSFLKKALEEQYLLLMYHGVHESMVSLSGFDEKKGYEIQPAS